MHWLGTDRLGADLLSRVPVRRPNDAECRAHRGGRRRGHRRAGRHPRGLATRRAARRAHAALRHLSGRPATHPGYRDCADFGAGAAERILALSATYWPGSPALACAAGGLAPERALYSGRGHNRRASISYRVRATCFRHWLRPIIVRATVGLGFTILTGASLGFLGWGRRQARQNGGGWWPMRATTFRTLGGTRWRPAARSFMLVLSGSTCWATGCATCSIRVLPGPGLPTAMKPALEIYRAVGDLLSACRAAWARVLENIEPDHCRPGQVTGLIGESGERQDHSGVRPPRASYREVRRSRRQARSCPGVPASSGAGRTSLRPAGPFSRAGSALHHWTAGRRHLEGTPPGPAQPGSPARGGACHVQRGPACRSPSDSSDVGHMR